jgi:hypothetical protein
MVKGSQRERAATKEELQGFLPIAHDDNAVRQILPPHRTQGKIQTVLVVFH